MLQNITIKYVDTIITPTLPAGDTTTASPAQVVSFLANLETCGYTVDKTTAKTLLDLTTDQLVTLATDVLTAVEYIKGSQFVYKPLYPNFPEQVINATDFELWVNATMHYFGDLFGVRIVPNVKTNPRPTLPKSEAKLTTLTSAPASSVEPVLVNIFNQLTGSKIPLNKTQLDDLKTITELVGFVPAPENIPVKETLAYYVSLLPEAPDLLGKTLATFNNPTDVLRVFAVKGGSEPTLTGAVKFSPLNRPTRQVVLNVLNQYTEEQLVEAYQRHATLWKLFFKHVRYGDYAQKYPLHGTVKALRAGTIRHPFNSKVERLFNTAHPVEALNLLATRPGLFVRRLRELLTHYPNQETLIMSLLKKVAPETATPVLWQTLAALRSTNTTNNRLVFLKGATSNPKVIPAATQIPTKTTTACENIILNALQAVYATREPLGKVFWETSTHNPAVPFGLRNTSPTAKMVGRGSTYKFDVKKTLRFFLHWKDINSSRVDIDLSASLLDENFRLITEVTYYNLKNGLGVHSGDITSAPEGASEYIDVNPTQVEKKYKNARYVVMTVTSFTGHPFTAIPDTYAGFMTREAVNSGEIYEPSTVDTIFQVNSSSVHATPFLFDLKTGEAVFVDIPSRVTGSRHNVASTHSGTAEVLKAILQREFVSVEETLRLNITARGVLVDTREEADTVIGVDTISTQEVLSDWL